MPLKVVTLARQTVTTAGTRQQVSATAIPVTTVVFQADNANVGRIYIGDSSVSATQAAAFLPASSSATFTADHAGRAGGDEFLLSDFYIDASTSADKVYVSYVKAR